MVMFGAPCEDMSKARLLPSKFTGKPPKHDPRPGLDGPRGSVFHQRIKILGWVLKHNPGCEYFVENVEFRDMPEHWNEVCAALGEPVIINSSDYSYTRRNRAYWTNIDIGDLPPALQLDPNDCLEQGRSLYNDASYRYPVGKSWTGDPHNPRADTSIPILVRDDLFAESDPQQLRPAEAEALMGMPRDCTATPWSTALLRLQCIGNGWDLNVVSQLLSNCKLVAMPAQE